MFISIGIFLYIGGVSGGFLGSGFASRLRSIVDQFRVIKGVYGY
jgi:hypothetical protein